MDINDILDQIGPFLSASPVLEGISNDNYEVVNTQGEKRFLTLYIDQKNQWKLEKELLLVGLLHRMQVPHASIIASGFAKTPFESIPFLVKEYIDGKNYDELMQTKGALSEENWKTLLIELIQALKKTHSVAFDGFGLFRNGYVSGSEVTTLPAQKSWIDFIDQTMQEKEYQVSTIADGLCYGTVCSADIRKLFVHAKQFYFAHRDSLHSVVHPFLTHNDTRFANIMARYVDQRNRWELAALIDFEWALAGDPELDLIQIENWLQFAPYKSRVVQLSSSLLSVYEEDMQLSSEFKQKRYIYHMMRSLAYLTAVFHLPSSKKFAANPENISNVEKHFVLLLSAIGLEKQLEEIF